MTVAVQSGGRVSAWICDAHIAGTPSRWRLACAGISICLCDAAIVGESSWCRGKVPQMNPYQPMPRHTLLIARFQQSETIISSPVMPAGSRCGLRESVAQA